MNLHSVDCELIASIFKYMDYPAINRLRKMNTRFNRIALKSNWLRSKCIQEQEQLFALMTSQLWEVNVDSTPEVHIIPTPNDGSLAIIYRELNTEDSEQIRCLGLLAFPEHGARIFWPQFVRNHTFYYSLGIFDLEENLLGFISVLRDIAAIVQGKNCSHILFLAIDENYRRYGLAFELLRRAIELAKQLGQDLIYLNTDVSNVAARKLYEKMGFSNEAVQKEYYRRGQIDSEDGILYAMRLNEYSDITPEFDAPVFMELKENEDHSNIPDESVHNESNNPKLIPGENSENSSIKDQKQNTPYMSDKSP